MSNTFNTASLDPRGRALFCSSICKKLPTIPHDADAALGKSVFACMSFVLQVLDASAVDSEEDIAEWPTRLRAVMTAAVTRAEEVQKRLYKPGDNYGFSGAADTSSERFPYAAAVVQTVAQAAELDVQSCLARFGIAAFQAAHDISRALDRHSRPDRQAILRQVCARIQNAFA